jgi:hypothetical protein
MRFKLFEEFQGHLYAVILAVGDEACKHSEYIEASQGKRTRWNTESAVLDKYFDNWTTLGRVHEEAFPDKLNPVTHDRHGYHDWVTLFSSPRTTSLDEARKMYEEAEKTYFSPRRKALGIYDFVAKKFSSTSLDNPMHLSTLVNNTTKALDTSSLRIEGQEKEKDLIQLLFEVYPEEMQRWRGHYAGKKFGF